MNLALWAMRLSFACRKMMSSTVTGTSPHCISSLKTFPAPTLGSWSGSPTSTTFASSFKEAKNLLASHMSTMENSSIITRSASSAAPSFCILPPSSPLASLRPLWRVHASRKPVLSAMRRLARPVGAIRDIFFSGNSFR